jgi:hypothetical protein
VAPPGNQAANREHKLRPVALGGTRLLDQQKYYYKVTACYPNGESGSTNQTSGNAGEPIVKRLSIVGDRLEAQGSGFNGVDPVIPESVSLDGIDFQSPPSITTDGKRLVQEGVLSSGQTLSQYLAGRSNALVAIGEGDAVATLKIALR